MSRKTIVERATTAVDLPAFVAGGASVANGQQIGEGALGNAGGCHLHFDVYPDGGTIY